MLIAGVSLSNLLPFTQVCALLLGKNKIMASSEAHETVDFDYRFRGGQSIVLCGSSGGERDL